MCNISQLYIKFFFYQKLDALHENRCTVRQTFPCRPYVTTMKAMQFNEYFQVFDLTEQLHYPELSEESLRLEMFFQFPLEQVTEKIVLVERLSNIQNDKFGTIAKNIFF